jgi:hypothetical protein
VSATIEVGGVAIRLVTSDPGFQQVLEERFAGFVNPAAQTDCELEIHLALPAGIAPDEDVSVRQESGIWRIQRGDFQAEWDQRSQRGWVRQSPNPYSIDAVLRIIHTLMLAGQGGFLLHASSAIRNGRAFLFSGLSGAGKTTISRLAPPGVTLLTDEISYLRPTPNGYRAYGTPFAGELAKPGENASAPVAALFFLAQGPENRVDPMPSAESAQALLRNILFFAEDRALVNLVFESACRFVSALPPRRLTFFPDARVWEMIK